MGVPATTARVAPVGIKLDDGFASFIAFAADPDLSIWEKTVVPPGLDGGDPIVTKTMHNQQYVTKAARALMEGTDMAVTAAYTPGALPQIAALINREGAITYHASNGDTIDFFGYLKSYEPQAVEDGTQPEVNLVIVQTNTDPSDGSEQGPVFTVHVGT